MAKDKRHSGTSLTSPTLTLPQRERGQEHYVDTDDDMVGVGWALIGFIAVIAVLVCFVIAEVAF